MNIKTRTKLGLAAGLLAVAATYSPVTPAQTTSADSGGGLAKPHEKSDEWIFTVGAGVATKPDYEGGDDYEAVPVPIARAKKGHRFGELLGTHVTSNLLNSPNWRLGPSFDFRDGYSDVDNDRVDALTDRGSSFEVGAKGGYAFTLKNDKTIDLAFEVLADVSSGHEGFLFTPSVDFWTPLGTEWELELGADVTYASGNFMSHYFSINERESLNSGLDNYDADADFHNAAVHVLLGYELTKKWKIFAIAKYQRMLGDAEDSPVVDDEGDENQFAGSMAVIYSW